MSTERWAPIPDFVGLYEVSDRGRVRSLDRVARHAYGGAQRIKGRVLSLRCNRYGYPVVALHNKPTIKHSTVHSLVLAAFVGPRPPGAVSRHLNGIRTDCRLENLAYGTFSENNSDRVRHGNDHNTNKTHCVAGHQYSGDNVMINVNGGRECRTCVRDRSRRYKERKAVAS